MTFNNKPHKKLLEILPLLGKRKRMEVTVNYTQGKITLTPLNEVWKASVYSGHGKHYTLTHTFMLNDEQYEAFIDGVGGKIADVLLGEVDDEDD